MRFSILACLRTVHPLGLKWLTFGVLALSGPVFAATNYYFDLNGTTAGSGATSGSYAWSGGTWTTAPDGTGTPGVLPTRNNAIFSAGGDGLYANLKLTGATSETASVIVQEGNVTIESLTRIFVGGSVLQTFAGTSLTIQNSPDFYNNTVTLATAADSTLTLAGANSGGSRRAYLVKTGPGLAVFQGANVGASGGTITINTGEFRIQHSLALPDGANLVNTGGTLAFSNNIAPARDVTLAGGTLRNVDGSNTCAGLITLTADSFVAAEAGTSLSLNPAVGDAVDGAFNLTFFGAGSVVISQPLGTGVGLTLNGPGTVGLNVALTAAQTWDGVLAGPASGRFFKQGGGVLTLAAASPFAGATTISCGSLALAASATLDASSPITVAAGAVFDVTSVAGYSLKAGQTLAGSGTVAGAVSAAFGSVVAPGTEGAPGTLTFSQPLVFAGGVTAVFDLATTPAGTGDKLVVTGNLTLNGTNTLRVNPPAAPATLANGTYPLIRTTGGIITGAVGSLQLDGFVPGAQIASLQLAAGGAGIDLVVATNTYSARALTWAGDAGTNRWDTGGAAAWRFAGSPVTFTATDRVTFDAIGAVHPTVALVGQLAPGAVTVNASTDYTFSSAAGGTLIGPLVLTKAGTGRLVITGDHSFSGGTTLSSGSIEVRTSAALGTGTVANAGTLVLAPTTALTLGNAISGAGGVVQTGGISTLGGANTFTGPVAVSAGTLRLGHASALGTTDGATTVNSGATLDLAGFAVGAEPLTLAGGTLVNATPASAASIGGLVTLSADSTVDGDGALTLSGSITGGATLTKAGAHTLTLSGDSAGKRPGLLAVTAGKLVVTGHAGSGPLTIASGATLGGTGTIGGPVTIGGTFDQGAAVATLTTTGNLTLQPTATTRFKIQKTQAGLSADRLAVSGTFTVDGSLTVVVGGLPLAAGDVVQLFTAGTVAGTFASVQLPYLYGDFLWDRSDLATTGILRVMALPAVSTQSQRREWLLTRLSTNPGGVDGFTAAGGFFARGDIDLGRTYALNRSRSLLANHLGGAVQVDLFYIWPAVDLVARYGQYLDDETKANIRQVVLTFNQYKDTTTSNLKTLSWVTRFLGGQLYGEAAFSAAVDTLGVPITNDWRASDPNARDMLLGHFDTVVSTGFGEIASRPYFWKNLLPILSLSQLSQDPVIRERAALVYEAGLAQNAGYWLRGHLAMPTTRSYPDMLEQHPSSGASIGMFWYHFGGDLPATDSDSALMTAMMNPVVSPVFAQAGGDRSAPFFSRSRNSSNYLQTYVERDYALFADGPVGPNSGQVYANGVVWTDSDRSRYSHLWVAKPIHDDPTSINVSNTHGKESRQFSETVARDALLYSFDIAPPVDLTITPTPTPYGMGYVPGGYRAVVNDAATSGQIFLHYGSVLIAIRSELPFGWDPTVGITYPSGTVRAGDSEFLIDGDTATTRPPATFVTPLTSNLRFAVAIETARPADFPGATPAEQLAAFRTAILAIPGPSRAAEAPTTAVYTTRRGDRLRLTKSQDISTYPVTVNDAPVEYSLFPRIENPWIYQPAGSSTLVLRSTSRREVFDFSTWTRTVTTGAIDVTPPVLANLPANQTLTPNHPQPTVTYTATATDAVDGVLPVTFYPPSGSVFTPGTTQVVTATATDSSLNTTSASFTVTVLPYATPPAPAAPWSVGNVGALPLTPGSAQHDVGNGVVLISGTGGTTGTGASGDIWSGTSEGFTYVSRAWTGDGVFTARVWSLSAADSGAKAGIMFRETLTIGAKNSLMYLTTAGAAIFQNKTATSGNCSTSTTAGRSFPTWIRLVRAGTTFTGFYSDDGQTWTQQGTATSLVLSGTALTVGLAVAPRTGGTTADVIFDHVSFIALPVAPVAVTATPGLGQVGLVWTTVPDAATYTVKRSANPGGPYFTIASGVSGTTYTDAGLVAGTSGYYVVTATNAVGEGPSSTELNAGPYTALQAWRLTYLGSVTASDSADPDGDGVPNLLEYALGTDPMAAQNAPVVATQISNSRLQISFPRVRSELTYTVEASSDLVTWTTIATNPGTLGQTVTVIDTVVLSTANPPRRFLRLRVIAP